MNRIVKIVTGVLVAILAILAIVPAAIDWNRYRAELATRAAQVLGRPVEIRGDLGFSVLPEPRIVIDRVHLGNIEGATDADMLSLDRLEVELAWAPLLVGRVRVNSVRLVKPVFSIEIFENGESNLTLHPREPEAVRPAPGVPPSLPMTGMRVTPKNGGGFDLSIEDFVVEKGTLVYRNEPRAIDERIDDLNGRVAFASLMGPIDASVRGVVRGVPIAVEVSASEIIQGRTVPFNLDATIAPGGVKVQFSGSASGLDDLLRLRGRLTAEGANLKEFAVALGASDAPDALRQPFGMQANLSFDGESADLADVALKLDGSQAQGRATAMLVDKPTIDVNLTVPVLDLDSLLRSLPAEKPDARAKAGGTQKRASAIELQNDATRAADPSRPRFRLENLPMDLTANVAIGVDAISWRGDTARQAKLDVSLANREITVSQMSVLLPGNSDVALFGFVTEKDAVSQFDGTFDASGTDLRATLAWLGVPLGGVASDALGDFLVNARLSARPDGINASEVRARVDSTRIDGAFTAAFASRPSFGANLTVDRVNFDRYFFADQMPSAAPAAPSSQGSGAPPPAATPMAAARGAGPWGFDANVRARVVVATIKGIPANDVRLEAALANGTLDVKSASVGDLAGIAASASGSVGGLNGGVDEMQVRDLVLDAKGKSLGPLFRVAGIALPVSADALGPASAAVRLSGPLRSLDLAGDVQAMGGRFSANGRLESSALLPRLEARLALAHPDAARLMRGLGVDWRPRGAKGGVDLAANVAGNPVEIGFGGLSGSFAGVRLNGSGAMRLPTFGTVRKPLVAMTLATGDLDLDSFLPQKRTAAAAPSDDAARVQPAGLRVPAAPRGGAVQRTAAARNEGPWSSEPIDLSALSALDGSLSVKSDTLRMGGLSIAGADLDLELQNGLLEIRHLTGKTFGGDLTLDGGLAAEAGGAARFEARYALVNADINRADRAFGAKNAASGSANVDGYLRGAGRSAAALVASLSGEGSLAFRGINGVNGQGSLLAAVGGLAQSLERLGGYRGRLEPVAINLSGPYRVEGGVVSFDELTFGSPIGEGAIRGKADLPRWQISASGDIRLAREFVIGGGAAKPIPFALDGALDAPRLKVDIAALPGGGVQIPIDQLRTKKGATEALKSLLPRPAPKRESPTVEPLPPPGQTSAPPPAAGAAPKPDAKAAPKAEAKSVPNSEPKAEPKGVARAESKTGERVEDILKDILRGVSR